jgi:hypothetical protein
MRALLLLVCLALAGCNSVARLDSDSFAVGAGGYEAFETDDQACRLKASDYVAYDLHVIGDTRYAANRAYNGVYGGCMHQLGHADRPYARNWLPG